MIKFSFRFIISLIPVIPLYFVATKLLSNDIQIFGFLSFYYLIFVLLVTPISKILSNFRKVKKYSNKIINYRRPIGILAGVFSLLHTLHFEENIRNLWGKYYAEKTSYINFLIDGIFNTWGNSIFGMNFYAFWVGMIGFIIMIILLVTSNDISQKIMGAKFWKYLQRLIYPLFIIVLLHIYFVGGWKGLYLYPGIILILLRSYTWFDEKYERRGKKGSEDGKYRKFLCLPCGFIYDEELGDEDGGLAPGTKFEDIPNNWRCPVCGVSKKDFIPLDSHYNPKITYDHELEFTLESKEYLTDDVVELVFLCKRDLEIRPGQFCNLIFKKGKNKITRSYSVAKYMDNTLTFLIRLTKDGEGSAEIRKLNLGGKIKALGPYGDFVLKNTSNKKVFIATGTGLSPIYHMIEKSWDIEKELYFGVQKEADLFYLDKLSQIPKLKVHVFLSKEEVKGYNYGRISYDKINLDKNMEVYICGSPGLIENLKNEFTKAGKGHVYFEKFL